VLFDIAIMLLVDDAILSLFQTSNRCMENNSEAKPYYLSKTINHIYHSQVNDPETTVHKSAIGIALFSNS